jgi:hypothetical protein
MMVIGVLGLPISGITVAMMLVKSYGTQTFDPVGFVIIVLGPAMLLATGFGLLRRRWWGRGAAMALLAFVVMINAWEVIKGPRPTTTFTSPLGVKTTVIGSGMNDTALPIMALCIGMLVKLCTERVRSEFDASPSLYAKPSPTAEAPLSAPAHRDWRVGHTGRDMMYYEEKIAGSWHRIEISGEMLMGRAHHLILFASGEEWQRYPEWARHRRREIMERIMSEFREPDYEYQVGGQKLSW